MASSLDYLRDTLLTFGFDEADASALSQWAWDLHVSGATDEEIAQQLPTTAQFKARHAWYDARQAAGLPQISVAEALSYERQTIQMFRSAGLPEGFYDEPSDFADLIAKDVSVAELSQRVRIAEDAVYNAPAQERAELERLYGIGPGNLAAYWIDPDKALPTITRKYESARRSGTALRAGYGTLAQGEAESLVDQGITQEQATQGFSDLARSQELFRSLDAGETEIDRETQLGATFSGDAAAKRKIEDRQKRRTNVFEQGGGFSVGQQGISGLG